MRISDWSSDVCSSDLVAFLARPLPALAPVAGSLAARPHQGAVLGPGRGEALGLLAGAVDLLQRHQAVGRRQARDAVASGVCSHPGNREAAAAAVPSSSGAMPTVSSTMTRLEPARMIAIPRPIGRSKDSIGSSK